MNELELLRDVVRAYVAERRADAEWSTPMRERLDRCDRTRPTEESIAQMRRLAGVLKDRQEDLDRAIALLAEVNPELVAG
jgi:hypothetical protein